MQILVHFQADAVLIERVKRIVRADGDTAELTDVVDHQLADLVLEGFGRHAVEAAEDEHRG
ncbi:hypothetical protein D3C76_1772890 [compost metagenome]